MPLSQLNGYFWFVSLAGDKHSDVGSDGNWRRRPQTNFHHGIYRARILMASLIISPRMAAWVIICYQFQLEKLLIYLLYKSGLTLDGLDTHPTFLSLWGLGSQRFPFPKLFQGFHRNGMSFQVLLSHVSPSLVLHGHGRILWSESLPISLITWFV